MPEDYGALREGLCPVCRKPLERHEDHARCAEHGCWSTAGDTISVYLHIDIPEVFRRP